ncbi:MAG: hypothetical protein IJB71_05505 [Bacilli bacterium]|nr:hypothetical protein [Bacilli bacterium]
MKNKQKKEKKSYLYIIFLALAFIILLGTGAYAYYQTTITGTITGNVARWSFKANNQTSTLNIDFGGVYPGKEASYSLELSAEDSELDVYYELIFHYTYSVFLYEYLYFNMNSLSSFNTSSNYNYETDYWYSLNPLAAEAQNVGAYGIIPAGETVTVPLYYYWPYDGLDVASNLGELVSAEITIKGQQYTGYSDSIPMNSLGLRIPTNVSANYINSENIIPLAASCPEDEYGYSFCDDSAGYTFTSITSNKGVIKFNY